MSKPSSYFSRHLLESLSLHRCLLNIPEENLVRVSKIVLTMIKLRKISLNDKNLESEFIQTGTIHEWI